MAINRYRGNSGIVERVPEERRAPPPGRPPAPPPVHGGMPPRIRNTRPPGPSGGLGKRLDSILSRLGHIELETEDIILLLILWLMYRESGDEELLLIMGLLLIL